MEWSACITLPPADTSPRAARALLRVALEHWQIGDVESADLLLTEVVTNAVVHAHTAFTIHLTAHAGWARFEVHDSSPEPPHRRRPTSRSEHGRGLLLLDRLADSWGWAEDSEEADTCKTVWFEVTADASDAARSDAALIDAFDISNVDPL